MMREGGDLKKRCRCTPKGDREGCFRDINQQNEWLLANIFDASGNYLYCRNCVQRVIGLSNQCLARLRKVKIGVKPSKHALPAKPSNRSVQEVKDKFLKFVDYFRSPNRRRLGSSGTTLMLYILASVHPTRTQTTEPR